MTNKNLKILLLLSLCVLVVGSICTIAYVSDWKDDYESTILQITNELTTSQAELKDSNILVDTLTKEKEELLNKLEYQEKNTKKNELSLSNRISELELQLSEKTRFAQYTRNDVTTPSFVTVSELEAVFPETLKPFAQYFVEAEYEYGINAIFLSAIAAHESGWGTSSLAVNKNNLFGVKGGSSSYQSYESKRDSIFYTAKLLRDNYLIKKDGRFYGVSVDTINYRYCPNDGGYWSNAVDSIAWSLMSSINEKEEANG